MTEKDISKEVIVQHFGIPDVLKKYYEGDVLSYEFEDDKIPDTSFEDYHCNDSSVKFALINKTKEKAIITMDFFKPTNARAFGNPETYRLELIYIHNPLLRRKGVGKYYVQKLKEYMLKNEGSILSIIANPKANVFKNEVYPGPNKEELVKFYKSFEDNNFTVDIL